MNSSFSYWEQTSFFNYDIVVTGSGIVGLNCAIHLKKTYSNLKIAILERGFLPSGASTKNAGFACFGSISELIEQENLIGTDRLANLIETRWKGLLKLRNLLGDHNIDYQCLGGYELFKKEEEVSSIRSVAKIEHFNKLLTDVVGKNTFSPANEKINAFGFDQVDQLIFNQYEAQIDTGKMMFSLISYAQQLGITILNNCEVEEIRNEATSVYLKTNAGDFQCSRLAIATNAFVQQLLPELDVKPGRGQVLITKPIPDLKLAGTFHYDKGFYYFRNINQRILLGGGRNLDFETEQTSQFGETNLIQSSLEELLKTVILPQHHFEIDQRWSGIMSFGSTLEPLIKTVSPNICYATCCNGMGVAIGSQTGEDLAKEMIKLL
ncbi:NAD(P)/FAD-dependent oxidoreductase [Pedobacter rhizosphaerae]|nr:FAD-binding oxidoreductase [Pedobacter rhizosphaerae]